VTKTPAHEGVFQLGERISVRALHTPCHTQDSICYFFEDGDQRAVFTGDTLFIGGCLPFYSILLPLLAGKLMPQAKAIANKCVCIPGCGRFFEGNAEQMHKALNETLACLPDDTKVYVSLPTPLKNKAD
jgi:hydroxyacylglutathione hydrolase